MSGLLNDLPTAGQRQEALRCWDELTPLPHPRTPEGDGPRYWCVAIDLMEVGAFGDEGEQRGFVLDDATINEGFGQAPTKDPTNRVKSMCMEGFSALSVETNQCH